MDSIKIPYGQSRRELSHLNERDGVIRFAVNVGEWHGECGTSPALKWYSYHELASEPSNVDLLREWIRGYDNAQAMLEVFGGRNKTHWSDRNTYLGELEKAINTALGRNPLTVELTPELAANVTASAHLQIVTVFHESMVDESEAA